MGTENTVWTRYADEQPKEAGVYRWRLPSVAVEGLVLTFDARMRMRGAGFKDVLSPSFDDWDGYRVLVPQGLEWRDAGDVPDPRHGFGRLKVEGLEFAACPYCGRTPELHAARWVQGYVIGPGAHRCNEFQLKCCAWGESPRLSDPREIERIRREAFARAAPAAIERMVKALQAARACIVTDRTELADAHMQPDTKA